MTEVRSDDLAALCEAALRRAGADTAAARVIADATVEAELVGNAATGVAHLFDYLSGFREGRIAVGATAVVRLLKPAVIDVDAAGGPAQTAFADAIEDLDRATRTTGAATLWIRGSYTCGELGYYPRRLARRGLLAVGVANSPALMSLGGATTSILGTNPIAFAVPRPGLPPLVIDQASSFTAYVNVRRAAAAGDPIPSGWALDADGKPTEDAVAALRGTLLPFGGFRGGNIALLVEILATLSGAAFSLEAGAFDRGAASPGIGLFVLAIDPTLFGASIDRLHHHLSRLQEKLGVRLPAMTLTSLPDAVEVSPEVLQRLEEAAE